MRTAREIVVKKDLLKNKNISVKIGTIENKKNPKTVYINMEFWIYPRNEIKDVDANKMKNKIERIISNTYYKKILKSTTLFNKPFASQKENIFIYNIPNNFFLNKRPSFISIELYLHTININEKNSYPLETKGNLLLFNKCLKIANSFCVGLKQLNKSGFETVSKKKEVKLNVF